MLVDGAVKRDDRASNPPLGQPLPLGGVYFNTKPVPTVAPAARVLVTLQALGLGVPVSPKPPTVKETHQVYLEYDRITRRRVLNTYEILLEIGRGEHGKVKLAKDLALNQLVAIKIILRKSKRHLFHGYLYYGELLRLMLPQERKVRREISIMKRCHHPHIVQLREVLDDDSALKIYLVLEYLEKGEIKWKRSNHECSAASNNGIVTVVNGVAQPAPSQPDPQELPCTRESEIDLPSDEYAPNLLFAQLRRALRHVVLGLEYLHAQGIVHRDIKPANLLVSATNCVKILDFGVSLLIASDGKVDLTKTAGTPAFFAPELCQDQDLTYSITHKIDIWALGVTLYCLLFGKVPFNAPTEWELFDVICHQSIPFPEYSELIQVAPISKTEYDDAQDLLRKLLDKNPNTRIDIPAIKHHPFTLMGCEDVELFLDSKLLWSPLPAPAGEPVGVGATLGQGAMILSELVNTTLTPTPSGSFAGKRPSTHEALLTRTRLGDLALRRGLVEACQIETMRHARGDVYLLSTPVLATIKGIQEQDDKRRRLSIFSNSRMGTPFEPGTAASSKRSLSALLSQASPVPSRQPSYTGNVAAPIAVPGRPRLRPPLAQFIGEGANIVGMGHSLVANHWAAGGNNAFVAPTSNAPGGSQGPMATTTALALLVLLLPLLELFALLDSFDEAAIDNFLSQCLLDNLGVLPIPQSRLALTSGITEKLKTFNLHMGQKKRQLDRGVGPRNEGEGLALLDCDLSLCLSSLESDDDNANLLFLFSSKLAPQLRLQLVRPPNAAPPTQLLLRPAFLNHNRRLALHDTHVGTRAGNGMLVVMIHDTHLPAPELADVPAGLFGQGLSAGLASLALLMPQAVPVKQSQSEALPQLIYSMPSLPLALTGRMPHVRQLLIPGPRSPLVKHVTTFDDARSRLNLISLAMLDRQHGT